MNFSARHAFGIVIGVAVTIVAANVLNMFLNWETAAIVCGLLLGLEAGFWSGVPRLTYRIHKAVFLEKFWRTIFSVLKPVVYYSTALAGFCLAVYVAFKVGVWMNHQPWLYWLFQDKDSTFFDNTEGYIAMGTAIGTCMVSIPLTLVVQGWLFDQFDGNRWWKCSTLHLPIGLATGLATGAALFTALFLVIAAFCLFIIIAALVLAAIVIKSLILVAGKHEAMTITVGVVIGGLNGLCYSRWTQLAFEPTSLSIMVGSATGLASAYAVHHLGKADWFKRLVKAERPPIAATTS